MELFRVEADLASLLDSLDDTDLCSFADLYDNSSDENDMELFIYTCLLIYQKSGVIEYIVRAHEKMKNKWICAIPEDDQDAVRRRDICCFVLRIFGTLMERHMERQQGPVSSPQRKRYYTLQMDLANLQQKNFVQSGNITYLNEAISITTQITKKIGDHTLPTTISQLGWLLHKRFDQIGDMEDIIRAIDMVSRAIDVTPDANNDRATMIINRVAMYQARANRTGLMDDYQRAIDATTEATNAIPPDHPNLGFILRGLGNMYAKQSEQTRSMSDLNKGLNAAMAACKSIPPKHPDRPYALNDLGSILIHKYEVENFPHILTDAFKFVTQAKDLLQRHNDQIAMNFATCHFLKYKEIQKKKTQEKETEKMFHLNTAIDSCTLAKENLPKGHGDKITAMINLGMMHLDRFKETSSPNDIVTSINLSEEAISLAPSESQRTSGKILLVNCLKARSRLSETDIDFNRRMSLIQEISNSDSAPSIRIDAASTAASTFITQGNWVEANKEYQKAISLLPTVSSGSLKHTDTEHNLQSFSGMASKSAAVALNAGEDAYHALLPIELGRGVIAGSLMEMREDISLLEREQPDLANKFKSLREELDAPANIQLAYGLVENVSSWEAEGRRRRQADEEFKKLVATIQTKPGFGNFLQPPTAEELQSAADPDPIIVLNMSVYRSDAFLIERNGIRVIELPDLAVEKVISELQNTFQFHTAATLQPFLEWLWDVACRPCLDALGFSTPVSGDNWPHVWWIATGPLSYFPFHAAGYHARKSGETVLDRVMSSYSPSIRALLHGRRIRAESLTDSAVLVAMQETPGMDGTLGCARQELDVLKDLCPSLGLSPDMPPSRKKDVLETMKKCKVFHFAGHGKSNMQTPAQSRLFLEDWKDNPLTVEDLRESRLQEHPPFLAYLSACSTGSNLSYGLIDEDIHLASAFQLAGFRHVVGTLWAVTDHCCVDAAKLFYETLQKEGMTDVAVYRGIHRVSRILRDRDVGQDEVSRNAELVSFGTPTSSKTQEPSMNLFWVPFIHYGV